MLNRYFCTFLTGVPSLGWEWNACLFFTQSSLKPSSSSSSAEIVPLDGDVIGDAADDVASGRPNEEKTKPQVEMLQAVIR